MSAIAIARRYIKRRTSLEPKGRFCYFTVNTIPWRIRIELEKVYVEVTNDRTRKWEPFREMTHQSFPNWLNGFFNIGFIKQRGNKNVRRLQQSPRKVQNTKKTNRRKTRSRSKNI